MRNRSIFFWIMMGTLCCQQLSAQKQPPAEDGAPVSGASKLYIKIYGGYSLLTPGSFKLTTFYRPSPSAQEQFFVGQDGMGAGFHYGIGGGIIANDFLNIGLDLDMLKGKKISSNNIHDGGPGAYFGDLSSIDHSVLSLIPNVTFKALSKPSYFIYTRLGVIIAIKPKLQLSEVDTATYPSSRNTIVIQTAYTFGLNMGAQAAFGVQFALSGKLKGFSEIVGHYLPVSPSSSVITVQRRNYDQNNVLQTSTSDPAVNVTYSNSGINGGTGANIARPREVYNINYIGINVGLIYKL